MSREEIITALADYFTGPVVMISSVGLEIGQDRAIAGRAFFEARKAWGIEGYVTKDEAITQINAALSR